MFALKSFLIVLVLSITLSLSYADEGRKDFTGYMVLEVIPADQQTVDFFRNLLINDDQIDFWEEPSYVGRATKFMVPPKRLPSLILQLKKNGIQFSVYEDNIQQILDAMWRGIDERKARSQLEFDLDDFNTPAEINAWLGGLGSQCREELSCSFESIGTSYENRPITIFRIAKPGEGARKAIYIDATIHAREWIATATILKVINALARGTSSDAVRLTEAYDFHFVPVVNPDGYQFTWTSNRLWRKNRTPIGTCIGTDLNRNFDIKWGTDGVSHNPCSDTFCGPTVASEAETQAQQNEISRLANSLEALITIHSYGRMWMFPWGTTVNHAGQVCERTDDHDDQMAFSHKAADAIQNTHGTNNWLRGNSCEVIYATSGSTQDFAKVVGIANSFTMELRGTNFVIDKSEIDPSFQEVFNGIVALVDAIEG